jgi:C-methyltransferase
MKRCRLCTGTKVQLFFSLDRSPSSVEKLLNAEEVFVDEPIRLDVLICYECGFIHLSKSSLPSDFYRKYDKSAVHSEKMRAYQDELARELARDYDLSGKAVLEVGCGDGYFAQLLSVNGAKVQAVEPGAKAAEMARLREVEVIEDYFHPDLALNAGEFDMIIVRQVLSHIENLELFMAAVSRYLKTGGLLVVEAPNVDKAIAERHYYDFFADYVNYFSPATLVRLMSAKGLDLVSSSPRFEGDYTLAVFRKPETVNFMSDFKGFSTSLKKIIAAERNEGRRVACWGAGGRGVSLLVMCGLGHDDISFLIDSSPDKQELFTPGSKFRVSAPSILLSDTVDTIIITAILFQDEILKTLKDEYQFSGRVVLLAPQPSIEVF